jgi:two-component system, cell cycle sensor histidine kinase and response regulator CckA
VKATSNLRRRSEVPLTEYSAGVGQTILLVEDEEFVREVTYLVLQAAGYRVLPARNAHEASELFARHRHEIQLLLTDVTMPGMTGREFAAKVRSEEPSLATIFMSGYPEMPDENLQERMFCLFKPFSMEMLTRKVSEVLSSQPAF